MQSARSVFLSGSIRYLTGAEKAFSPGQVLSCSASAGVRDGMLPGAVVSRQCTLMLHNENDFFTAGLDLYGARVQLFVQAENEEHPLAVFQVTSCTQLDGSAFLTLSGQDVLGLYFDAAFQDDLSYPATLQTVAERVLEKAGFPASLSFPCAEHIVPVKPEWGDISLRGALGFIAQACGCFAMVSPAGEIGFYPAFDGEDALYEIFPENTFRLSAGDVTFGPLKGISIALHGAEKEDEPLAVSLDDTVLSADNCLYLERNPLFMKGQSFSRTLATDMLSALRGMHLSRMQLSWQGDPRVMLGKRIRVWDTKGGFTDTCVTSLSFTADNGFSMQTDCTYQKKGTFVGRVFTSSGGINSALLQGEINGALLKAESVTARKIAASSVTTEKLAAGCVTAETVASGSISANHLQAGSVTSRKLAAGSITTEKLAAGAVTADKIAGKTITADKMQAGLITADSGLIGDSAIGTAQIADGSITDAKIVGLTASKITAGTLDAADVNVINLKADNITAGTLNGKVIPQLGTDKIQDGAVSGVKIVNGAVNTDKISDGAVTAAKIVSSAVTTDKLAANAVTANKILSGAVTTDKLSANAVTTDKLAAQSVTANKLASDVGRSLDLSSNNSVKLMVDDIRVGGVNLLPDTRLMASWVKSTGVRPVTANVDDEGFGVLSWPASDSITWAGAWTPSAQFIGYAAVRNKEVTVSFDFKSADWIGNENVQFHFDLWNGGTKIASKNFAIPVSASEDWHRVKAAFEITDAVFTNLSASITDATKISVYPGINRKPACALRRIKVEIGNKATDWSPAPEDGAYTASAVLDRTGIHLNTGGTFTVDSQNFGVDGSGKMTAKAGLVGGWNIAPGNLSSGSGTKHVRLSVEDATYAIWAGAEAGASAPFRVTRDGKVYLTKLYVTDENGNAQANPVNLSGSWWRTNRAVRELTVDGNTLTITLYDGTTVNFKKADVVALDQSWANGRQTITTTTDGITLSGETTTSVNGTPANLTWSNNVATFNVTSDKGTIYPGMKVDAGGIYKNGWNECINNCSGAYVLTNYYEAGETLYDKDGNVAAGPWYKGTRAYRYTIPAKKA